MKKTIIFSLATMLLYCLLSCERPSTIPTPPSNDSTETIQDSIVQDSIVNNPDTFEYKEERHVASVYLVNHLDKPIDLEMHHDSIPLAVQEELSWYRDANVQKFTLQSNDTVYCDSVVYLMDDDAIYFMFPGDGSYKGFVNSYFFIKINYNNQQYEYTDKTDIQNLLYVQDYRYIVFNEEKKNAFDWK